ncbi:ATP-binding protein [Ornithinimicrobium flavum]|uniref:ATP-binding protein n=1 Tax=Ornithinimicrobium flavum TaxID=1288636 RepID=UPI00106F448C|nr:ATP-binding protein [Ornithinimicrobium flavum]
MGGDVAEPVTPPDGSVLVLGPPGSGRSWTLQVLASLRQGATLRVDGLDPPDVDDLRERLKDPACLSTVVVDDAHLLAGTAVEDLLLDHATSTGADLLVAADLESAAGSFRGLVPATARARCAVLLQPEAPAQGGVVGVQLPVGDLRVPGRGVLVRRGRCTRVQVVSPPAAP